MILVVAIGAPLALFALRAPRLAARRAVRAGEPRDGDPRQQSAAHGGAPRRCSSARCIRCCSKPSKARAFRSARRISRSPSCRSWRCWRVACRSGRRSPGARPDLRRACARCASRPSPPSARRSRHWRSPRRASASAPLAIAFAAWLIVRRCGRTRAPRRIVAPHLPARASAGRPAIAHAGLGIVALGVAGATVWKSEAIDVLGPGRYHDHRRLHFAASMA